MLLWNAAVTRDNVRKDAFVRAAGQGPEARPVLLARIRAPFTLLIFLLAPVPARAADCIPIHEAGQHIGETRCVVGKVVRIEVGKKGVHFLDFCEDAMACPFTVVVFSNDLKDVGDVRRLAGRTIEIRGAVKAYEGRPEIILSRISQIEGGAAMIPPLPKELRRREPRPLQCRKVAPLKKTCEEEIQAEHNDNLRQRCGRRRSA